MAKAMWLWKKTEKAFKVGKNDQRKSVNVDFKSAAAQNTKIKKWRNWSRKRTEHKSTKRKVSQDKARNHWNLWNMRTARPSTRCPSRWRSTSRQSGCIWLRPCHHGDEPTSHRLAWCPDNRPLDAYNKHTWSFTTYEAWRSTESEMLQRASLSERHEYDQVQ